MIRIVVGMENGAIRRIDVEGHAGGKRGTDIVCAAVSAVVQTALLGLLHHGEKHVTHRTRDGSLSIKINGTEGDSVKNSFNAIMSTMLLGLRAIEREHPDRVTITMREA